MNQALGLAGVAAVMMFAGHLPTYAATAAPAAADAGPVIQNSRAMAAADQIGPATSIRQQIHDQLGKIGYTNIDVIPSSFLVRATDKQGNPVEMVIGPDSVTTVIEHPATTAAAPTPPAAPAMPATKG